MSSLRSLCLIVATAMLVNGCAALRTPLVPMPYLRDSLRSALPIAERTLMVILPGSQEVPQDLVDQGFVEQVRARGIAADIIIADAAPRHYTGRLFEQRLRLDIIEPARQQGYREIWLAGISLGGLGTLLYSSLHAEAITGAIALAPFVAQDDVLEEVIEAGGLREWQVQAAPDDWQRQLLIWLRGYADPVQMRPLLYVGFGIHDGYRQMEQVFDGVLAAGHLRSAPGDHDWPPWKQLWGEFLDMAPLMRVDAASG